MKVAKKTSQMHKGINDLLNKFHSQGTNSRQSASRRAYVPPMTPHTVNRNNQYNRQQETMIIRHDRQSDSEVCLKELDQIFVLIRSSEMTSDEKQEGEDILQEMFQKYQLYLRKLIFNPSQIPSIKDNLFHYCKPLKILVNSKYFTSSFSHVWKDLAKILNQPLVSEIVYKIEDLYGDQYKQFNSKILKFISEQLDKDVIRKFKQNKENNVLISSFKDILTGEDDLNIAAFHIENKFTKPNFLKLHYLMVNRQESDGLTKNMATINQVLLQSKMYLSEMMSIKDPAMIKDYWHKFEEFIREEHKSSFRENTQGEQSWEKKKDLQQNIIDSFFTNIRQFIYTPTFLLQQDDQQFHSMIIKSYCEESQIYRSVNAVCRFPSSRDKFGRVGIYCKFLAQSLKFYSSKHPFKVDEELVVYHGGYIGRQQRSQFENKNLEGTMIYNLNFMSTSLAQQTALTFMTNDTKRSKDKLLIQISYNKELLTKNQNSEQNYEQYEHEKQIKQNYVALANQMHQINLINGCCNINTEIRVSQSHERQVLFNIFNIFKVVQFIGADKVRKYNILKLEYPGHLELVQKRQQNKLSPNEMKVVEKILSLEVQRNMIDLLAEKGQKKQILELMDKMIKDNIELTIGETEKYIEMQVGDGNAAAISKMIEKNQQNLNKSIKQKIETAMFRIILEDHLLALEELQKVQLTDENSIRKSQNLIETKNYRKMIEVKYEIVEHKFILGKTQITTSYFDKAQERFENAVKVLKYELAFLEFMEVEDPLRNFNTLLDEEVADFNEFQKRSKQIYQLLSEGNKEFKGLCEINIEKQIPKIYNQIVGIELMIVKAIIRFEKEKRKKEEVSKCLEVDEKNKQLINELVKYKNNFLKRMTFLMNVFEKVCEADLKYEQIATLKKHLEDQKLFYDSMKPLFPQVNKDQKVDQNNKYQTAIFFKNLVSFLNIYNQYKETQKSKIVKTEMDICKYLQISERSLRSIHQNHIELPSVISLNEMILSQKFFSSYGEKQQTMNSCESQSQKLSTKQKRDIAKKLRASKEMKIDMFSKNNSILNETICRGQTLEILVELLDIYEKEDISEIIQDSEKCSQTIKSKLKDKSFLRNHTSAAFYSFQMALLKFKLGEYKTSFIEITKSEKILDSAYRKDKTNSKKLEEFKFKQLCQKQDHLYYNDKLSVKIRCLKARICIEYNATGLKKHCLDEIQHQIQFLITKVSPNYSELPFLLQFKALLQKSHGQPNQKILLAARKSFEEAIEMRQKHGIKKNKNIGKNQLELYSLNQQLHNKRESQRNYQGAMTHLDENIVILNCDPEIEVKRCEAQIHYSLKKKDYDKVDGLYYQICQKIVKKTLPTLHDIKLVYNCGRYLIYKRKQQQSGINCLQWCLKFLSQRQQKTFLSEKVIVDGKECYRPNFDYRKNQSILLYVDVIDELIEMYEKYNNPKVRELQKKRKMFKIPVEDKKEADNEKKCHDFFIRWLDYFNHNDQSE